MKIQRVGATKSIQPNVRVIAATNANLEDMIKEQRFQHKEINTVLNDDCQIR